MTSSYIERELKFDIEPDFVVPDLASQLPPDGRVEAVTQQLRSEYFDTEDRALLRARITLRRRTGDADVGWQLKVPAEAFREEISSPDDGEGVPAELARLVAGVAHGRPLRPVATLSTSRSITRLLDGAGQVLAEIADDTVRVAAGGEAALLSTWREMEVELGGEDLELLSALAKRLRRAGAKASPSTSKLARALGPAAVAAKSGRKERAGDVVGAYLAEQQQRILLGDLALRRGDESVIHPTRVATRRLRSTLRVFSGLFDEHRASALDEELRWFAALLGAVRDNQVLQARLRDMIGQVDPELLLGPVRKRVNRELRREWQSSWKALQAALGSERYLALLAEIDDWVQSPPHIAQADRAPSSLAAPVRKAQRKVAKRLRVGSDTGDVELLHGARKAAKRARYANEATGPALGRKKSRRQAKRYQDLQDLLGEHQDSLIGAALLRRIGAKAGTIEGENGFAFGILYERERQNAARAEADAKRAVKKLT